MVVYCSGWDQIMRAGMVVIRLCGLGWLDKMMRTGMEGYQEGVCMCYLMCGCCCV